MKDDGLEPMGRENPAFYVSNHDVPNGYVLGTDTNNLPRHWTERLDSTPESVQIRAVAMASGVSEMRDRHFPWLAVGGAIGVMLAAAAVALLVFPGGWDWIHSLGLGGGK